MPLEKHSYLRRLPPQFYQGSAYVHWTMTIAGRKTGWLDAYTLSRLRDVHAHTLHRYSLICPIYCAMPDHMHFFWIGLNTHSDQLKAVRFFRQHANNVLRLSDVEFQAQAYDNVLRENDREENAVIELAYYITENPVRAGHAVDAKDWVFSASHAIGYPDLDWRMTDFADRFWKIFAIEAGRGSQAPPRSRIPSRSRIR